jgi:hypothetical protein
MITIATIRLLLLQSEAGIYTLELKADIPAGACIVYKPAPATTLARILT